MNSLASRRSASSLATRILCPLIVAVVITTPAATAASSKGPNVEQVPVIQRADQINVAAASDLIPAFTELGKAFTKATGIKVVFTFGSSGQLAAQTINGAPFDVFASADTRYIDEVVDADAGDPKTRKLYAFGRLTLWTSKGSKFEPRTLAGLRDPAIKVVAIADPAHAPYGRAAQQALQSSRVWDSIKDKLVYGQNISATQQLVATGNADVGIIALSLSIAAKGSNWTLVPASLHTPLAQMLVVTSRDLARVPLAKKFIQFEDGKVGRAIMERYGFLLPGQKLPQQNVTTATSTRMVKITSRVRRGSTASLTVASTAKRACSIAVFDSKARRINARGLVSKQPRAGTITWRWTVARLSALGKSQARVSCPGAVKQLRTSFVVVK